MDGDLQSWRSCDLAGHHLSDDPTNLTKYTIPDTDPTSTFLTENDHLVVWLDQDSAQGVLHANFKLSSEDEGIWLTAQDGVTVLDSVVYPPQQTDISYGRACDGCEGWTFFNVPTPAATNVQTTVPTPTLYINEVLWKTQAFLWMSNLNLSPGWKCSIPTTNRSTSQDTPCRRAGGSATIPNDAPIETTVEGNGFLLLWMDGEPEDGAHHLECYT